MVPPPVRERSRSATRPPAPAAGSHGGRGEQASPRQRARTPHRSRPEKAGEHEPEWYGGPRPPWKARRQSHPLCCLPREGRGTERGRATPRPTGPTPAAPRHTNATDPPRGAQPPQGVQAEGTEKGPHTHTPAPTTCRSQTPTARPVGGQSGEGERLTPDAPRNSRRHPPRGRPTATPSTPSQVRGNQDRTAPPQARHSEQGTGAGHAEGHGPRGTALPAPSAGTTRGAHATPPRGGGSGRRGSASAHTRKGHAGTTRRATGLSARNAQTAWNGVPASEGKGHPDGTARHTQRRTRGAERGKRERRNTRYRPEPPEPAASAAHTQTGHCTRQGSSGAQRHAPTPNLGSLRASPRGSHWRQASSTGPAAPAPRPRIRGATQWVSARSHGCELMH